jgi:hypothetical protein
MASSKPEKTFAEATAVKAESSNTYSADFPSEWCIGSGTVCLPLFPVALTKNSHSTPWRLCNISLPPGSICSFQFYTFEAESTAHHSPPSRFPAPHPIWACSLHRQRYQTWSSNKHNPHYPHTEWAGGSDRGPHK